MAGPSTLRNEWIGIPDVPNAYSILFYYDVCTKSANAVVAAKRAVWPGWPSWARVSHLGLWPCYTTLTSCSNTNMARAKVHISNWGRFPQQTCPKGKISSSVPVSATLLTPPRAPGRARTTNHITTFNLVVCRKRGRVGSDLVAQPARRPPKQLARANQHSSMAPCPAGLATLAMITGGTLI